MKMTGPNSLPFLFLIACSFGALYKGLAPNIGRGMAMNVGMMACSDQAKELMIAITKVPAPYGESKSPRGGGSLIAAAENASKTLLGVAPVTQRNPT